MIARLRPILRRSRDLLSWLWALVVLQPLVPTDHPLGRDDLAPWLMLCLAGLALLRGAPLGAGPHPMLRPRRVRLDAALRRVGLALLPAALLCAYDAGGALRGGPVSARLGVGLLPAWGGSLLAGACLAGLAALALFLGRAHGATAWSMPRGGVSTPARWLGLALGAGGLAFLAGLVGRAAQPLVASLGPGLLLGVGVVTVGLAAGRPHHRLQRAAAQRAAGPVDPVVGFRVALAAAGPTVALVLLAWLGRLLAGAGGFSQAFLGALLVVAWGAVLWPKPAPRARLCLLREVVPAGGHDRGGDDRARDFDEAPEGALRLDPLHLRPTRRVHAWMVPVREARVGAADDPVAPLWPEMPSPPASSALGSAAFLPDPRVQDSRVTVELQVGRGTTALRGGEVQTRRLVVLRDLPALGESRRPAAGSWTWEAAVPAVCRQEVDATTRQLFLEDGQVLVLSSEGVARAFVVELGEVVDDGRFPPGLRMPQLEDYAPAGGAA